MSIVFAADGLGSMRSRREACSENQIQLIGIEAREFDDLPISKPNGPFIAPNR
jgi:hypothetical protein